MDRDVIISGAGPVGLMLACELGLRGVTVTVLERLTEPDMTVKAGSVNIPTIESFDRRGLLPKLEEAQQELLKAFGGIPTGGRAPVGHFAGIFMWSDKLEADALPEGGLSAGIGLASQQQVEAILAERAAELGVDVRRGVQVTAFVADDDGVTVQTSGGPLRSAWLVGCDGGRSLVRKMAGFDFPGTDPEITGHQAVLDMEGAESLGKGWHTTPTGTYAHGPMPGRILTVEFDGPPADRDTPITREELETSVRHVTGADIRVTGVRSATRYTDNARQAATYRLGRVLLAGDAAHVHSPFGGQGLNLGIGDAMNLGWKLAATVRGWAPDGLLDTYTTERHPIGEWVLNWTRAQIALMRTDPQSRALRAVVGDLLDTSAGTTYMAKKISGLWQGYGDDPLVGRSAPDLALADGSRLADHLHDGRGLLLDLGDTGPDAAGYEDRVTVVSTKAADDTELTALLVRPDGVVAWAGDGSLDEALATWFGSRS